MKSNQFFSGINDKFESSIYYFFARNKEDVRGQGRSIIQDDKDRKYSCSQGQESVIFFNEMTPCGEAQNQRLATVERRESDTLK